jgi:molecular chaperone DnaJ
MSTKDWLEKDYYKILGVSKDAKPEEIKKAFRKLARENHPDQHPDDKESERRFKEISEANSVLSDTVKRKEYDDARSMFGGGFRFPGGGQPGRPGQGSGVNLEDLFRNSGEGGFGDLFGGLFGGQQPTGRRSGRGPRRGGDIEGEVAIPFADAAAGVTVGVQMVSEDACDACRGTGAKAGTVPQVCPTCQGSGMQASQSSGFAVSEPCRQCRGRGLIIETPCPVCSGTGRARSTRTMQVRIPAGVDDGQRIRIKGKGGVGENGGASGDLYVTVHVTPHPIFGRNGDALTVTVPVTYSEATLGAEIDVPTLADGTVRLRVPAGTPNGRTFRVKGRGVGKPGDAGDMLVTVEVAVPQHLSDQARAALAEYQRLAAEPNPRTHLMRS